MKFKIFTIFAIFLIFFHSIEGFSMGAPTTACNDLRPIHQLNAPQPTPPPFTIDLSTRNIQPGGFVSIIISSDLIFRGFMVQPRIVGGPIIAPGTFTNTETVQTLGCHGGTSNTATQVSNEPRTVQTLNWNAPVDFTGRIQFQ